MTREDARKELASLCVAAGGFTTVNAFLPLTLGGTTKVLNIFAREDEFKRDSGDLMKDICFFNLDTYVLRRGTVADEDDMDDLHEIILAVVIANPAHKPYWSHLQIVGNTEIRPVQEAGTQYLRERHKVSAKIMGT